MLLRKLLICPCVCVTSVDTSRALSPTALSVQIPDPVSDYSSVVAQGPIEWAFLTWFPGDSCSLLQGGSSTRKASNYLRVTPSPSRGVHWMPWAWVWLSWKCTAGYHSSFCAWGQSFPLGVATLVTGHRDYPLRQSRPYGHLLVSL